MRTQRVTSEEAMSIDRRKELYEKLHPETKQGGDRKSKARSSGQNGKLKAFAEETAKKTGKGRSTVSRSASRGKRGRSTRTSPSERLGQQVDDIEPERRHDDPSADHGRRVARNADRQDAGHDGHRERMRD
jgi:hypothetical protein